MSYSVNLVSVTYQLENPKQERSEYNGQIETHTISINILNINLQPFPYMSLKCKAGIIERVSKDICMHEDNPFTPGSGISPPYLAGRESEQSSLVTSLREAKDSGSGEIIVMYGPRGTGKTVLLNWFKTECSKVDVLAIPATPSTELESIADLPRLLLPASRLPDEVSLGVKGVLSMAWKSPDTGTVGKLRDHLIAACRKTPRVLLLDEAHILKPDVCRELLNISQAVLTEVPFLLVLTGTPGLQPFLMSVGATFVERSEMLGIGRLNEEGAAEAISIPLQQDGISIEEGALSRAVKDAQCYPYFLQLWGRALWDAAAERDADRLTNVDVEQTMPKIAAARELFYKSRYNLLREDKPLLAAAYAVACAFRGESRLASDEIPEIIERCLPDTPADRDARDDKARQLSKELNKIDFVWEPTAAAEVEPGIPSFMTYVQSRVEKSKKQ